jgi:hypothetical protein
LIAEVNNASPELEFVTASGSLYVKKLEASGDENAEPGVSSPILETKFPSLPPSDPVPENFKIGSKVS